MGTAIASSQLLAAAGFVDLGKSIYLQPSFSAPVMFFGGLLFGYGMVLSNGCGSRALVLLGRGNLRSFVVVIVLGIFAEMTLKGLIAPGRIAMVGASQTTATLNSLPALLSTAGLGQGPARMLAASLLSAALAILPSRICRSEIAWPDRRRLRRRHSGRGRMPAPAISAPTTSTGSSDLAHLHRADRDALQYAVLSTGSTLNFGIVTVFAVFAGSLVTALATGCFHLEGYQSPRHMLRSPAVRR
jgi:hypothetical protein